MARNLANSSSGRRAVHAEYALVKWVGGVHDGTYTHNIQVDWIQDLNGSSPLHGETYAIEWRVLPKPRSGWPVLDAVVLDTSSQLNYLQAKMREQDQNDRLTSDSPDLTSRSSHLMDITSDAFKDLVRNLIRQETPVRSSRDRHSSSSSSPLPPSEEKVCIGKSLWVSKAVFTIAQHATSPGRIVRPLLRQAFSRRRLVKSSYAGQRRSANGHQTAKPGLKRYQKMADIQTFVLQKYPALSQASFGAIVNSFLGPRPNAIHQIEYVEESESEDEMSDNSA